jgi:protein kinase-like protein
VVDSAPPPSARTDFGPGSEVAGYRLEEQLGRGGMAVVFRAHDDRLNRQVALKILAPALAADQAFRQRFIAESRAAAAVDDPNIIPVYEAGDAHGVLFIAMRLVRGGDLKTMVGQHGPLSPARAAWILSAVASALDAAHAAGLIHRDVKPANMLLEEWPGRPDHVYLSDFGVSKAALATTSGLTGSGQFLGTVDYAAPEQIQDRSVDGRTDQYALGCSAFELLCGRPPFFGKQLIAGMYAHVSEPPPPPTSLRPELPAAVDEVFARVLAKSPADRYASCQDFAADLRAALGVSPYLVDGPAGPRPAGPVGAADGDDATLAPSGAGAVVGSGFGSGSGSGQSNGAGQGGGSGQSGGSGRRDGTVPGGTEPLMTAAGSTGPARRSRAYLLTVIGTVLLLVGGALAAVLLTSSPAAPAYYRFATQDYPGGLTLGQAWALTGAHGSALDATITATNTTDAGLTAQLEEPVPAGVAGDLQAVRFEPAAKLLTASRVAVWDLRLPAHGHVMVRYRAPEPAAGASLARLQGLVAAFGPVAGQQVLEPIKPGGVLQSLTITPASLRLNVGQRARLRLRGSLSTDSPAPAAELTGAVWTTEDPAVAVVTAGREAGAVLGMSAGVTVVTVRIGPISDSVIVTVAGPGSVVPTIGGFSPPTGPIGSPPPSSTPTASVTPTQSVTPTSTPSPTPTVTPSGTPTTTPSDGAGAGPPASFRRP